MCRDNNFIGECRMCAYCDITLFDKHLPCCSYEGKVLYDNNTGRCITRMPMKRTKLVGLHQLEVGDKVISIDPPADIIVEISEDEKFIRYIDLPEHVEYAIQYALHESHIQFLEQYDGVKVERMEVKKDERN